MGKRSQCYNIKKKSFQATFSLSNINLHEQLTQSTEKKKTSLKLEKWNVEVIDNLLWAVAA